MSVSVTSAQFDTEDGVTLSGTWYVGEAPEKIIVLNGATGVPERFYHRFAKWLARDRAAAVLTYTYRDMHDTSPRAMRRSQATIVDWGITDGLAARDAARTAWPDLPLWVIGHSLGAMVVSKQKRTEEISRLIAVASGLVSHKDHPMPFRLLAYLFWFLVGPVSVTLMGYLPGKTIGFGSTLPGSVFWQWRRWCIAGPRGLLNDTSLPPEHWHGAPVRIVAMSDDQLCAVANAFALEQAYPGAPVEKILIDAKEHGPLGHVGAFTKAGRKIWPLLVD